MKNKIKYNLYATLLDSYDGYLNSDIIYNEYYGFSDSPQYTEDEFHEKQRLALIDRINRVPFDSEKADRGTAFNEAVDCLILHKKSDKMELVSDIGMGFIYAEYNNRTHRFPIALCREFADYYRGATPQVLTEGILPTRHGDVLLYGYIDELLPTSVHDIKTTEKYTAGKFKSHWQHMVYPYCLNAEGNHVYDFEYNIAVLNENKHNYTYETFTEYYNYVPEVDIPRLTAHVEGLIELIERHREVITDKKIFNQL
jgi:hypothetical protein